MVEIPITVEVKQRKYGTERSINILDQNSRKKFIDTQNWRLKKLEISGDLREELDLDSIPEAEMIGHIEVDPETFEWGFIDERNR
ncbi:hypothetical protein [Haloplanus halobius]|uniref:hypothetical protein n=1 Tax=Haloplanus halobius TaxID=2934938 RepID=UPI00201074F4|nr:hypothetical protein [Haloplanus sp. XH21]